MPQAKGKRKNGKKKHQSLNSVLEQAAQVSEMIARAGNGGQYEPVMWTPANAGAIVDVIVPSGQLCQVQTVGVPGLVKAGILDHVDSLTAIVSDKYLIMPEDDKLPPTIDVDALKVDEQAVLDVYDVMNRVVIHCVIQPPVFAVPRINEEGELVEPKDLKYDEAEPVGPDSPLRESGVVYVDTVPEEDQAFIFQYVMGGTSDLERFRYETEQLLGGVEPEPADEVPPL